MLHTKYFAQVRDKHENVYVICVCTHSSLTKILAFCFLWNHLWWCHHNNLSPCKLFTTSHTGVNKDENNTVNVLENCYPACFFVEVDQANLGLVEGDQTIIFVPLMSKKEHRLTVLSLCGTSHWDFKPGKRLQDFLCRRERLKNRLLISRKQHKRKEVFRLYKREYKVMYLVF